MTSCECPTTFGARKHSITDLSRADFEQGWRGPLQVSMIVLGIDGKLTGRWESRIQRDPKLVRGRGSSMSANPTAQRIASARFHCPNHSVLSNREFLCPFPTPRSKNPSHDRHGGKEKVNRYAKPKESSCGEIFVEAIAVSAWCDGGVLSSWCSASTPGVP